VPDTDIRNPFRSVRGKAAAAVAGVALLAVGGGVGAVAMHATRLSVTMAPATPVAIKALQADAIVTIKGRVAEIFGNKFIVQDASGRALVEIGREGEDGTLVTAGEPVTVQGRFDHGFVRAAFLVGPDAKVVAIGPLGGPHGEHDRHGRHHGRDDGPDGPPPPRADGPPPPPPAPAAGTPTQG